MTNLFWVIEFDGNSAESYIELRGNAEGIYVDRLHFPETPTYRA